VEEKQEEKKEIIVDSTQPLILEEKKEMKPSQEEFIIEAANYLSDILDIPFPRTFKFAQINKGLTKEQLLELYFVNPRAI